MEHRELKKLVQLMNDNGLVELEIEEEGRRVSLRKAGANAPTMPMPVPMAMPQAMPAPAAPAPAAAAPEAAPVDSGPPPGTKEILSPMVGTFYRRPSPDADNYVDIGDRVDKDTVVCIVEAMKVNNEIKAELGGEIVAVHVEDGHPVEFDQPLFRVKV
ncbi:MAG: acetyl-CoA carboxylase biotin carboxyl carrier protein [Planctomycetota bacterium]|nr:acetyl-CoA carboxylase biotin carboxyl carrier protein [Planctomycetota bacterium]